MPSFALVLDLVAAKNRLTIYFSTEFLIAVVEHITSLKFLFCIKIIQTKRISIALPVYLNNHLSVVRMGKSREIMSIRDVGVTKHSRFGEHLCK